MRKYAIPAALLACVWSWSASAQNTNDFGLGVIVGDPTGLSAKLWLDREQALDFGAAWALSGRDSFQFHMDYLYHRFDLFHMDESIGRMALYFGGGARFRVVEERAGQSNQDKFGIRVPIGVTYLFAKAPFDVFGEVAPILDLAPDTKLDMNVSIGGRFYFGRADQLRRR
jgi:hypothetical protein